MSSPIGLVPVAGMVDLALKSLAVMLASALLAAILWRASAAWRHLAWCLGIVGLLLLPVLSMALPAWQVSWLPGWPDPATSIVALPPRTDTADPTGDIQPDAIPGAVASSKIASANDPTHPIARLAPTSAPESQRARSGTAWTAWLLPAWLLGAVLAFMPVAVGLFQLAGLRSRATRLNNSGWLSLLTALRAQLGVRRHVALWRSAKATMPLTWGALRPVLLVPADADQWSNELRRMVLLHELAHIRRWDWLTQMAANVACAMYWFNPLVWLAARQMRIERERACDDLVLASGAKASDYAQELLQLAAGLADPRLATLAAVPMARRRVLEDRLRAILDHRRSRAVLTVAAVSLAAVFAAASVAPLAMLRAAPPQPPASLGAGPEKVPPVKEKPAKPQAARIITVRGKVVDDATGESINRLVFQGGRFDPSDPMKVTWGYFARSGNGSEGSFLTTIRWGEGWTERVVVDGYVPQPLLASAPPDGKDDIEVTIRLKRGPKVRGVVLDHAGKPLQDAAVFPIVEGAVLNLAAGQAWSQAPDYGQDDRVRPARTDEQGRFELATGGAKRLAVSHARFDAWPAEIPDSGEVTVRLPEPASVEVNLDIDGADKESVIFYQLLSNHMPEFGLLQSSRWVKVANPGKLSLAALPPGKYQLCRRPGKILERQLFEIAAGEVKTFDFVRRTGARVRGKVTWPAGAELSSIGVSVVGETTHKSPFDQFEWNTVFAALTPGEDGTFLTERIPPGTYQLQAYAFKPLTKEQMNRTGAVAPSYHAQMRIEVPAEGELKVDDLALKPIRADEPKQEPPAKEKPTAEKPAQRPAETAAAPQKDPLLGKEAAERVKQFPPSFSKTQEGVEIGISLASDRKAFHEGERVPLEFVIRNVSQKTLQVEHGLYPPETPPTVIGADGKQLSIEAIYLLGANRRYRDILKPNDVAVYRHMGLGLGQMPNVLGTFWHPYLKDVAPGKYRLSQQVRVTVREEGQEGGGTSFHAATGEVAFEIEPADPKKGPEKPAEKPVEKPAEKPVEKPAKPASTAVIVQGKVVDDATGERIGRFVTQGGKFDPADPKNVTWGYSEGRSSARDGSFSTTIRWGEGWTARILADGYLPQPVIAAAPPADKDEIDVTIRLKRGRTVRGQVLDHTDKPVKGAAVFAIGPTGLNLAGGKAWSSSDSIDNEARPATTDDAGRFELPAGAAKSLAVSHAGFDGWPAAIAAEGDTTIRLPQPARVDIEFSVPGADKEGRVFYQLLTQSMPDFAGLRSEHELLIANGGKLSLPGLTPGRYQMCREVMNRLDEIGTGAMLDREFFEIKAGETKLVRWVRDKGARIRGKITWPADVKLLGIVVAVKSEKAEKDPFDGHDWQTTYASHTAAADGSYLTERVLPGKYLLEVSAYTPLTPEQKIRTGLIPPSFRAESKIEVPAEGELTVPDLVLTPTQGR